MHAGTYYKVHEGKPHVLGIRLYGGDRGRTLIVRAGLTSSTVRQRLPDAFFFFHIPKHNNPVCQLRWTYCYISMFKFDITDNIFNFHATEMELKYHDWWLPDLLSF